jgi:hypothetical protein
LSSDGNADLSDNAKIIKKGKKAEQYRKQSIIDKHGVHNYDEDPEGYRKARKRE